MPNNIYNKIQVSGDQNLINMMLKDIKSDIDFYGINTIDFNKIIPMPDNIIRGDLSIQADSNPLTWYNWCTENWGVKWNAYTNEQLLQMERDHNTILFITAWEFAIPVIVELSRKYNLLSFDYTWVSEDIGYHSGRIIIQNGQIVQTYKFKGGEARTFEFAANILNIDLNSDEYELVYNPIENAYNCKD